jgi:hypothetical protein
VGEIGVSIRVAFERFGTSASLTGLASMDDIPSLSPDRITYLQKLVDALESPEPFTGTIEVHKAQKKSQFLQLASLNPNSNASMRT